MGKRIKQSRWRNSRIHFKDHDGHNLEIIYFPSGKGDPLANKH